MSHGTILIIVAGTLSKSGPAETFEVKKKKFNSFPGKLRYNAERVLRIMFYLFMEAFIVFCEIVLKWRNRSLDCELHVLYIFLLLSLYLYYTRCINA